MPAPVSLDDQIVEVVRELRLRKQVYPRWTAGPNPKLAKSMADQHMARLEAVLASLSELHQLRKVAVAMGAVVSRHSDGLTYTLRFRTVDDRVACAAAIDRVLCPIEYPADGKPAGGVAS